MLWAMEIIALLKLSTRPSHNGSFAYLLEKTTAVNLP